MEPRLLNKVDLFDPISLSEMGDVELLKRTDTKFQLTFNELLAMLEHCNSHYQVLEVAGNRVNNYSTDYFDTEDFKMYFQHHNRKLNRYKVRYRKYLASEQSFLEVKFKNNKGNTIKTRMQGNYNTAIRNDEEQSFVQGITRLDPNALNHVLNNKFSRITMVSISNRERVTIDFDLSFQNSAQLLSFQNTVVVEVKRDKNSGDSPVLNYLKKNTLRPTSFSKYCFGTALLQPNIKQNQFKQYLNKILIEYGNS